MKHNMTGIVAAVALGLALVLPSQTAAQAGKPASATSLADVKAQLTQLQNYITIAIDSLNQLKESAKHGSTLDKAAADFQNRVKALETQVETTRKHAVVMRARTKEHYDSWQKELIALQSAKIREKAQARFAESKEEFDKIISTADRAKEEALPFVSELKDIALFLDADQSRDAVMSLSQSIWKLSSRSKSVNSSIAEVNEQIDRTIKSLPAK